MSEEKGIVDSRLYTIITNMFYFLVSNLVFLVAIAPLIIYVFLAKENISIRWVGVLSILLGPAISTLCSVMNRFIRNEETSAVKDFLHFYKYNWFQGFVIAIILNILLMLGYIDMNYFYSNGKTGIGHIFLFYTIIVALIGFYIYPIISRYNMKIIDAFKISVALLVRRPYLSITGLSIMVIFIGIISLTKLALVGVLFGASIVSYIVMRMENKTIVSLEDSIKKLYEK